MTQPSYNEGSSDRKDLQRLPIPQQYISVFSSIQLTLTLSEASASEVKT